MIKIQHLLCLPWSKFKIQNKKTFCIMLLFQFQILEDYFLYNLDSKHTQDLLIFIWKYIVLTKGSLLRALFMHVTIMHTNIIHKCYKFNKRQSSVETAGRQASGQQLRSSKCSQCPLWHTRHHTEPEQHHNLSQTHSSIVPVQVKQPFAITDKKKRQYSKWKSWNWWMLVVIELFLEA